MPFSRRLALFIFGILLGSVFVYAILIRGKDFPAWLPEDRVLESLREHPIQISSRMACELSCLGLQNTDVVKVLSTAEVLFSESDVRGKEQPEYVLKGKLNNGKDAKMKFRTDGLTTRAVGIVDPSTSTCNCNP